MLFLDARHIYRQLDRAHRDWTPAQIGFLANVVRLYRGEAPDFTLGGDEARAKLEEVFGVAHAPSRVVFGALAGNSSRSGESAEKNDASRAVNESSARAPKTTREGACATLRYADVAGLCKAATLAEIEAQGWSLNPGRYVGVAPGEAVSDEDFKAQLETLNAQARELEETIAGNVAEILEV